MVKTQHELECKAVRRTLSSSIALFDQVVRFKDHTLENIGSFEALIRQEYGATISRLKGYKTLTSTDGLYRVQVAGLIDFGLELQTASGLVEECLAEWTTESGPEIRAIVSRVLNTDKADRIHRVEIFILLRLKIDDERWAKAMRAIKNAIRIVSPNTYVRSDQRTAHDAPRQAITNNLTKEQ